MATRNIFWTLSDATSRRALDAWRFPDAHITLSDDRTISWAEQSGFVFGTITWSEVFDHVTVFLSSDATYDFIASTETSSASLSIFDSSGYLLVFTDPDDIGIRESFGFDSILSFRPSYSGTFYLSVSSLTPADYGILATADWGSDGVNSLTRGTLSVVSNMHRAEGQTGRTAFEFTVTRSGDLSGIHAADWQVTGTGANPATGADFAGGTLPSGRIVFAPGETTRVITLDVLGDTTREANETFTLTLSNPAANTTLNWTTANGTILADEPTITVVGSHNWRAEGQSGTTPLLFTATRTSGLDSWDWVDWYVSGSGANPANGADFAGGVAPWGRAVFAPGQSWATIAVDVAGDTQREGDEEFTLNLVNPSPGAALATTSVSGRILADEPTITVVGSNNWRAEGQGGTTPFLFTAIREGGLDGWDWVDWWVSASGGIQASPDDFAGGVAPWGRAVFAPGQRWASIEISVVGDQRPEGDETFSLHLLNPSPGAVLANTELTGKIIADEPVVSIVGANSWRAEGNAGGTPFLFTALRTGDLSEWGWVDWWVEGFGATSASGADFAGGVMPWGRAVFAPGQNWAVISVGVAADYEVEAQEAFRVHLVNPSGGATLGEASAVGQILNDDTPPSGVSVTSNWELVFWRGNPVAMAPLSTDSFSVAEATFTTAASSSAASDLLVFGS